MMKFVAYCCPFLCIIQILQQLSISRPLVRSHFCEPGTERQICRDIIKNTICGVYSSIMNSLIQSKTPGRSIQSTAPVLAYNPTDPKNPSKVTKCRKSRMAFSLQLIKKSHCFLYSSIPYCIQIMFYWISDFIDELGKQYTGHILQDAQDVV